MSDTAQTCSLVPQFQAEPSQKLASSMLFFPKVAAALVLVMSTSHVKQVESQRVPSIPNGQGFEMPGEEEPHEGTWLQWPHRWTWDPQMPKRYEPSWIAMTEALHTGEKVHIIVDNNLEKRRVSKLLKRKKLNMSQIDFVVAKTNDVWVRDNGPIFVRDPKGKIVIQDWKFNGWGRKRGTQFRLDDKIPTLVGKKKKIKTIKVPMVNEGGSIELDGRGTLMAKRSSILNDNRNKGWKQADAERYFRYYLGVTNFIWLDGIPGLEITDDHIDGTARFANGDTIVTYKRADFVEPSEYDILSKATDVDGEKYNIVHLPITKDRKINGEVGIYINYYVGNDVVICPKYDDPSDAVARDTLTDLYKPRKVVMIDFTELYKDGGIAHCVTQQQPLA